MCFFNRGNTEETNSSKILCLMFVYFGGVGIRIGKDEVEWTGKVEAIAHGSLSSMQSYILVYFMPNRVNVWQLCNLSIEEIWQL